MASAGDIPAANSAAAEVRFLGAHSVNGTTHAHFNAADAANLKADAGTLDTFNNDTL